MTEPDRNFRDRLLNQEAALNPVRHDRQQALQRLLEQRLGAASRGLTLVLGLACILFAAGTCYAVLGDREAYSYLPNIVQGVVVASGAAVAGGLLVSLCVRGVYRRDREGRWVAACGLALLAAWGLFMLLAGMGVPESLRDIFCTLGLLCLGAAAWIAQRLSSARTQLETEKRLLELEYHLADIASRLPINP